MMDDSDLGDVLGGLQRQKNIRQNEALRREISGLRDDLNRKGEEERIAPKCPYCAGSISAGVSKCRHCSSEIEWTEFGGSSYPAKTGGRDELLSLLRRQLADEERGKPENCQLCGCDIRASSIERSRIGYRTRGFCAHCFLDQMKTESSRAFARTRRTRIIVYTLIAAIIAFLWWVSL